MRLIPCQGASIRSPLWVICQSTAVKTTFNTEARTISTTYAPQPWDFDHTGSVPIWRLLDQLAPKWLDTLTHWFTPPEDGPPFADMFFFRCIAFRFSRSFYTQLHPGCALAYSTSISNIGKTSIAMKQQVLEGVPGNNALAEGRIQYVCVSSKTRRPEPWAPWLRQRYPDYFAAPRIATVEPFNPSLAEPEDSFVYTVNVAPSDTDLFGHVGHFQFVRYCFDCLSIGREHSAYPALSQYKTEKVEVLFQGEARTGDVLTVVSWEDPEQSGTIKFQIKKGEDNVAQCSLQFFSTCSKM
ncbi:uncharacterized protein LOC144924392 [Branchiostoma floridae x Branchiostoma belcheri]